MNPETLQKINLFIREVLLHHKLFVGLFAIISLTAIFVGVNWPKTYTSSTNIYVEYKNIIDPLMAGTAVRTDVAYIADNAREIVYGRSFLFQVLKESDLLDTNLSLRQLEQLMQGLKSRTEISNIASNIIQIRYQDEDPERAFKITQILAKRLIQQMLMAKTKESRAAFEFINDEIKKYEETLNDIQAQLNQLHFENPDAPPGLSNQVKARIDALVARIDDIEQELQELLIAQKSLREQLSGEAEEYLLSRAGADQARIAELSEQLETLRLNYKETYPDIVQIKQHIANLRNTINHENQDDGTSTDKTDSPRDQSISSGEIFQALKRQLFETNTKIKILQVSLVEAKSRLANEREKLQRMQENESIFNKLKQNYGVNNVVYEDLLKRREKARVSMNLGAEQGDLTVQISEPAFRPQQPDGLRLFHFAIGGLVLGSVLPIALLGGVLIIDPRVRLPSTIAHELELPMLETIPHLTTSKERGKTFRGFFWSSLMITLTLAIIIAVLVTIHQGRQPGDIVRDWLKNQTYFDCPSQQLPWLCSDFKEESNDS